MKNIPHKKPKVIIAGIDKMVSYTGSWFQFLQKAGVNTDTHEKIYRQLREHKISWEEAKPKLFPNLQNEKNRIHKNELEKVFERVEINGEAFSTINELRELGFKVCLVSGSIDMIVAAIAKKLQIKDWYANTKLVFDKDGYWVDMLYQQDEESCKLEQAMDFIKKNKYKKEECLVLGHGPADMKLFKTFCGITIGSNYKPLKELACQNVKYYPRVLQFLRSI